MNLWSRDHVRSHGKLKNWYLFFPKVYEHQTWQFGDLGEENPPMESHDCHMILLQRGNVWPSDKRKVYNVIFGKAYGYET